MRPESEELLQRVLLGELDAEDSTVRTQAEKDTEFATGLADVVALQGALDRLGQHEREALSESESAEDASMADAVEQRLLADLGHANQPRSLRWVVGVVLAAAALVIALLQLQPDSDGLQPGQMLGPGDELVSPTPGSNYARFEWTADLPPHGWYEVVVYDPSGRELTRSYELEEAHWTPESTADWTDEVLWRVRVYDAGGNLFDETGEAGARR